MTQISTLQDKLQKLKSLVGSLWYVKKGDIVESRLHNLFVDCLYLIEDIINEMSDKISELEEKIRTLITIREEVIVKSIIVSTITDYPEIKEEVTYQTETVSEDVTIETEVTVSTS